MRTILAVLITTLLAATGASSADAKRPDPDGRYRGGVPADNAIDRAAISFRVSRDGRRITRWTAPALATICTYFPNLEVETYPMVMPTIKVAKNGRFRRVFKTSTRGTEARYEVSGRLKGRRVINGRLRYDVGVCVRGGDWRAKRVSR